MLWLPFLVITILILFFGWLTEGAYPEIWAAGESLGESSTRAGMWVFKLTKGVTLFSVVLWWLLLFTLVFAN